LHAQVGLMTPWQSRIVGHEDRDPADLKGNPLNWRSHPQAQTTALSGVLDEVGVVQGVIFNQRTGHLIDGHLRVELAVERGQAAVPVTIVDLSEDEERLVLATLDPLGAMANTDADRLQSLLSQVKVDDERTCELLAKLGNSIDSEEIDLGNFDFPSGEIEETEAMRKLTLFVGKSEARAFVGELKKLQQRFPTCRVVK